MAGLKIRNKHPQGPRNYIVEGGLLLWPDIAMARQKYIAKIANLPGPNIYIALGGLLLRPELLWPDSTVSLNRIRLSIPVLILL